MNKLYYYQALARLLAICTCLYTGITAAVENNLTKQTLVSQAEQFVLEQLDPDNIKTIEVVATPIDDRVQVPKCLSALTFSSTPEALSQSNVMVKAQCSDNNWYIFMVVKAIETQPVVVISSAVSPGTLLTTDNLHVVNMNKKSLRSSTFADIEDVIGARIKRRVTAGRPVNPNNLCYVCKGDSVTISAGNTNMRVKTTGVALEDGKMGETIQVKNRRSSKKIYARVAGTGQVEIGI
ncbi:flagellar basal body P-ring formation chaperone FlgA [uncultured Paraglaciecola sp.]|uniref:flagellar basal body P-ring formation chaperone FlgA n=1 Tax=uncultured Paraglaciecola sp. TaxID=1765024 RepID=UPI0030D7CA7D|tara:strand:- start:976 stop:1686 length:711 start_codon:yes stop_codon:yes gene_type:complete